MDNQKLETEIKNIKARNARVELDKKWETSWTRNFAFFAIISLLPVKTFFIIQHLLTKSKLPFSFNLP